MYYIDHKIQIKKLCGYRLPRIVLSTLYSDNWECPGYLDISYVIWSPFKLYRYRPFQASNKNNELRMTVWGGLWTRDYK